MDRLHMMQVFLKVAESGGFAEAGRQLSLSAPTVTRAVSKLEDAIGARLLVRTTRAVRLTDAGERYAKDCREILGAVEEAETNASGAHARPRGQLTITTSVLFGQKYVMPIVTDFLEQFQEVSANVLLLDRVVNLVEEGVDLAIRIGHLPDSSYSAIKVGTVRRVVCASPDYLERYGIPIKPADLQNHRIVATSSTPAPLTWRFYNGEAHNVSIEPQLLCNTNTAAIDVACSGWGITRALSYQVGSELLAGKLQTVLGEFEEAPLPIHIVHPDGLKASAKVRSFIDCATIALRSNRLLN